MHDVKDRGVSVGGFYQKPKNIEWFIDDRYVDGRFGLIVVATMDGDQVARSTLAHEWRHHWQQHNGIPPDNAHWNPAGMTWEQAIRKYFRQSKTEMDALLFEQKVAPCDSTRQMLDAVMSQ